MSDEGTIFNISIEKMIDSAAERAAAKALELHLEKTKPAHPAELWTAKKTYNYLGVSYATFKKFIAKGVISPISFDGVMRFDPEKIINNEAEIRSRLYER
ncbi:MAG TPA: hypothetical protein ENI20_18410 [Bacteroides sp.]|nr:hypothetical protein [Bacteroides sp.]